MSKTTTARTAQAAQREEATGTTVVSVEYRGATYSVDRARATELDVLEALEDEKIVRATRLLLGPEQYARLQATKPKPNLDTIVELFEALTGAAPGN